MSGGQLEPRAVALLVALRAGPLNIYRVAHAIGEHEPTPEAPVTRLLIDRCTDAGLVRSVPEAGLVYPRVWLTADGVAWLQLHGLDARYAPPPG